MTMYDLLAVFLWIVMAALVLGTAVALLRLVWRLGSRK